MPNVLSLGEDCQKCRDFSISLGILVTVGPETLTGVLDMRCTKGIYIGRDISVAVLGKVARSICVQHLVFGADCMSGTWG